MSNNIRKFCGRLLLVCMMAVLVPFESLAATARIAFSDPSAQVGSEVSVTMKFSTTDGSELGNTDVMLAYDATALEYINETENASGGNGAIRVWSGPQGTTEAATRLRFKALKAGKTTITVSSWEGYDNSGQMLTVEKEGTSTITVAGLETSSSDAKLQSLQIYPGTLEPSFSPDTLAYTTSVGLDVQKLTIDAKANNDKATVAIEGGADLQDGENTVVCKVTAEDGTTVGSYTITVNKVEGGASDTGAAEEPTTEAAAAEPDVLAELDVLAKKIRIIELPEGVEVPAGLRESAIKIGDTQVKGWITDDEDPQYCVIYGINEKGEADFYRFDLKDRTVQRYFRDTQAQAGIDPEFQEKYNHMVDDYNRMRMFLIAACVAAAVLLIALIAALAGTRSNRRRPDSGGQDEPEAFTDRNHPARASKAQARVMGGKKLSREERYMMGEEEEYTEEYPDAAYQDAEYAKEPDEYTGEADPEQYLPEAADEAPVSAAQEPVEDVEKAIARNLAKEAAAAAKEPEPEPEKPEDDDDFEIFSL